MKLPSFPNSNGQNIQEEDFNPFPDLPPKGKKPKISKYLIVSFTLVLMIGFFFLGALIYSKYYSQKQNLFFGSKEIAEVLEPPSQRAQIFEFNHDIIDTKPQPYKAIIDPIDPQPGEIVKLTIYMNNSTSLISVTSMLETDTKSIEQPLTLSKGDSSTGVWTGKWKVEDTYNNTFHFILIISDDTETYEGVVAIK